MRLLERGRTHVLFGFQELLQQHLQHGQSHHDLGETISRPFPAVLFLLRRKDTAAALTPFIIINLKREYMASCLRSLRRILAYLGIFRKSTG